MNATDLIARILDKYKCCSTYSDHGAVEFDATNEKLERLEFRTRFIRPDYLSFEWQDYGPWRGKSEEFSLLWLKKDRTVSKLRWGLQTDKGLDLAIASATGCSAGAASIIPSLLLPDQIEQSKRLGDLQDLEVIDGMLDKEKCFIVKGTLFKKKDHVLWISQRDLGIRRVLFDRSWTAQEAKANHEELMDNPELLTRLQEMGRTVPANQQGFRSRRLLSDYKFEQVRFDAAVAELDEPGTRGS